MAETSTIFGFMKYVSATDILSDFKKTVDSYFVNSLIGSNLISILFSLINLYQIHHHLILHQSFGKVILRCPYHFLILQIDRVFHKTSY